MQSIQNAPIIVVSGLPRSGTSMMMKMLADGGIPPVTDGNRQADESNLRGYLEFEPVKRLAAGGGDRLAARRARPRRQDRLPSPDISAGLV